MTLPANLTETEDATISQNAQKQGVKPKFRASRARTAQSTDNPKIVQKLADMPMSYRKTYKRAMTGKSLRAATKSFCLECVGWQRNAVARCTSPACPLYPYRPYQEAADSQAGD
jgi:hypothetical protein